MNTDIIKHFDTSAGGEFTPPELLSGMYVRGHVNIVASKPGVGKTWLTLIKARSLAREGLRTLLFNGESGYELLQYRAAKIGFGPELAKELSVVNMFDAQKDGGLLMDDPTGWKNIQSLVAVVEPDVIVFDSFVAFLGSDESEMKTVRDTFVRLKLLAERYECAVVLNHHLRKKATGTKTETGVEVDIDDFIGSSVIGRLACNMFAVYKDADLVKTVCVKSWYKKPRDFAFILQDNPDGTITVKVNQIQEAVSYKARIVSCFGEVEELSLKTLVATLKQPYSTVGRYVRRLVKEGVLTYEKRDGQNILRLCNREADLGPAKEEMSQANGQMI